uniref:class I SAM-dependent methyltransferase n=1 Tax=Shewanella sp. TaxID=50422 RepID=UPI0040476688
RNNESRRVLENDILSSYLKLDMVVLDYGCGPGFLAKHVCQKVKKIYAVDIDEGVIACAKIINPGHQQIDYRNISGEIESGSCELVYSFAVFQHLTSEISEQAISFIYNSLALGGRVIVHLVIDADGWDTESNINNPEMWIKRKYGLNCFSRSYNEYYELFYKHGFRNIYIQPAVNLTNVKDDIRDQHILIADKQ